MQRPSIERGGGRTSIVTRGASKRSVIQITEKFLSLKALMILLHKERARQPHLRRRFSRGDPVTLSTTYVGQGMEDPDTTIKGSFRASSRSRGAVHCTSSVIFTGC